MRLGERCAAEHDLAATRPPEALGDPGRGVRRNAGSGNVEPPQVATVDG